MTATSGASGNVVLSGLASPSSLVVAKLAALSGPYGTTVRFYASATHVPADGTSTIVLTFVGAVPATGNTFTIQASAGRFTAASGMSFVSAPTYPATTLTTITSIGAGASATLTSGTAAGPATVTVSVVPTAGTATIDSATTFTFTGAHEADGDHQGRDQDRGMGHGARKVGFFQDPAWTCATGAQPAAHAGTFGFAILNTTGHHKLNVNVVLRGALANATYDVWLNQDPGGCPLATPTKIGAIHTDANGNGHAHLRVTVIKGATHFWVSATSGTSVLRTRAAALWMKHS
jgi:hypothetical protein